MENKGFATICCWQADGDHVFYEIDEDEFEFLEKKIKEKEQFINIITTDGRSRLININIISVIQLN